MSFRFRYFMFLFAVGTPVSAVAATPATEGAMATPAFQSTEWRVECGNNGKTLDCQMVNRVLQQNGAQIVSITVHPLADGRKAYAVVQLPLGIALGVPVQLSVDGGLPVSLPLDTCLAQGCLASALLSDAVVTRALTGAVLKLSFGATSTKTIVMTMPLSGFAVAYDHIVHDAP